MVCDLKAEAALALHRFGLGPRPDSMAAVASDPRGALLAELDQPNAGLMLDGDLPSAGQAARAAFVFRQQRQEERKERRQAQRAASAELNNNSADHSADNAAAKTADPSNGSSAKPNPPPTPGVPQQIYLDEAKARTDHALNADIGFVERLVWFWSNHFCVSADKGPVRALCGAYEREAIRPHVLGRFADMLIAAESHPAMLIYLDNARSIGPDSVAGRKRGKGLNENLAREILELHTLGVRTGYNQDDVTSFAKVITGWTLIAPKQDPVRGGEFVFNPAMHEPGDQTVIARNYAEGGVEQGRAVLADLARHPATAKHLATKLACCFVADQPPPALVDRLTERFLDSEGDLKETARSLVGSDEAWTAPRSKLKSPAEWILASLRAAQAAAGDIRPILGAQNTLGQPLWRPPAPKGFSDDSAAWMDGVAERLDIANQFSGRFAASMDPQSMLDATLGPLASAQTRTAIARAASRPQALTLLLMSPEFQRK